MEPLRGESPSLAPGEDGSVTERLLLRLHDPANILNNAANPAGLVPPILGKADLGCGVTNSTFASAEQGPQQVAVGDKACDYDHLRCPVTSVDLPMKSPVTRASSEAPYLCEKLRVNPQRIVELATLLPLLEPGAVSAGEGIVVGSPSRGFSMQRYNSCDCSKLRMASLFSRSLSRLRGSLIGNAPSNLPGE